MFADYGEKLWWSREGYQCQAISIARQMAIRHEPTADGGKDTGTGLFSSYEFRNHRNAIGFTVFVFQDLGIQSELLVIAKTCKPSSADPGE